MCDMGESNDSFFENALLKNINEDIPINVDLSDTPEKSSVSTMRTSTISKTERYSIRFMMRQWKVN